MSFLVSRKFLYFYFVAALLITGLVFFPAHRAMLTDDGINGLLVLKTRGMNGFWNSYDTNCYYYSFWSFLWLLYLFCKTNTLIWFAFFAGMHALNTVFIFITFKKLYAAFIQEGTAVKIAFVGSLFFLCSPFLSENILWTATHHYAITCFLFLWSTQFLIDFITGIRSGKKYLFFIFLFAVALTTFEITFFFPVFYLLLFVLFFITGRHRIAVRSFLIKILLPLIVVCGIYLAGIYFIKGILVPHYYADEVQFSLSDMAGNFFAWYYKFWLHLNQFDIHTRDILYGTASRWLIVSGIYIVIHAIIFFLISRKSKPLGKIYLFLCIGSALFLLPVLHLHFSWLFRYENDRYLYFYSVVAFQWFVFICFQLHRYMRYGVIIFFFSINIIFFLKSARDKAIAATYLSHYVDRFEHKPGARTFIFNMPYTVRDQRVFYYMDGFTQLYELVHDTNISGNVFNVLGVVCNSEKNAVYARRVSDSVYHFQLQTEGEWYKRDPSGSISYENAGNFICEAGEWNSVTLTIRNKRPGDRILVFEKGNFREIE